MEVWLPREVTGFMKLYLDEIGGRSIIPCPQCDRRLVLGVEKMGRLLVGYQRYIRTRPGMRVLLLCPSPECDYQEEATIAQAPDDAIAFDPWGASYYYETELAIDNRTLDNIFREVQRLKASHRRVPNPKLPALIKYLDEQYRTQRDSCVDQLQVARDGQRGVVCCTEKETIKGRLVELLSHGLLVERDEDAGTVFIRVGDLKEVYLRNPKLETPAPSEVDKTGRWPGVHLQARPSHFAIVQGCRVEVTSFSPYHFCRVQTSSEVSALALGIWNPHLSQHSGEIPLALVSRAYRVVECARIGPYGLRVSAGTSDPDVFQLTTRNAMVARALGMRRSRHLTLRRRRRRPTWYRLFHRSELDELREIQIPLDLTKLAVPKWDWR